MHRSLVGLPRDESVRSIAADALDVIVDLNGHTLNSGLPILAHRVAPVQVCAWRRAAPATAHGRRRPGDRAARAADVLPGVLGDDSRAVHRLLRRRRSLNARRARAALLGVAGERGGGPPARARAHACAGGHGALPRTQALMRWTLFVTDFRALMPRLPHLGRNVWNSSSNAPGAVPPMLAADDATRAAHGLPAVARGAGAGPPRRGPSLLEGATAPRLSAGRLGARRLPFVFGVLSNFQKIDPAVFDVWCAILRRVPHAVLWLQRHNAAQVRAWRGM